MKDTEFKTTEPFVNLVADKIDEVFESENFKAVRQALQEASASLPEGMSLTINCRVEAFDRDRGNPLRLLETGITTSGGEPPYRCSGDSTIQRYVVDGEICEVPHDQCPACWGDWDFKNRHRSCLECGITLGKEIKILLDSDNCPHCEKGKVSVNSPVCQQCGYEVDMDCVTWG